MDYFWIIVGCIELLEVGLLLFGLLTACVARWRRRAPAFAVLALFILCVVGAAVLVIAVGQRLFVVGPHFTTMRNLLIVTIVVYCIGNFTIGWFGWRRRNPDALPAAATWPRSRLLLAFLVALSLSAVTNWNVTLSVQQRLAREEVEARVVALSVLPGRPIDSLNAAVLYEPVFERLPEHDHEHKVVQDDWLDFDKPLDTDDPVLRELLASYRQDLDALVRASTRPQCYVGIRQPRDFGDFSCPLSMHVAGSLLAVDARVSIADGELENAVRSTSALFRMARHTDQTPTLVNVVVSCEFDGWAIDCVQALLNHRDLSAEILSELQLEARADYHRTLRRASTYDEAGAITLVKRISAEGFAFIGEFVKPGQRDTLGTFLWTTTNVYFIEHELEAFRSFHYEYRALLDQGWPIAEASHAKYALMEKSRHRGGLLGSVLMPGASRATFLAMFGDVRHRQARLAIAMRRYELDHGELPENFDDLIPTYMEEIPLDPTNEKPFKMEVVEGGVRLYSAGVESWDRNEHPGNVIKDAGGMVEMYLKARNQADN